jgi:hypothetical protein
MAVRACVLAVVCFGVGVAASGGGAAMRRPTQNRRAAERDAAALLAKLVLPPGAVRLAGEPSGDGRRLARPPTSAVTPALVDRHAFWRVPADAASVLPYVEAHAPSGGKLTGSGAYSGAGSSSWDLFAFKPVPEVLATRWLLVEVTLLADGSTGVRADGQVVWIVPRAVGERIPSGVRAVDVTRGFPSRPPALSIHVSSSRTVRKLVSLIDRQPVTQPGVIACPALRRSPITTFTFLAADGQVLAQATEPDNDTAPMTCAPMTFTIRGRRQRPLVGGPAFRRAAGKLLGVKLGG